MTTMQGMSLQNQVAWACRILAMDGHTDLTLGHVTALAPNGEIYMKCKDLGLNEVTPADVLTMDLNGRKLAGNGEVHLEAVLHTEVYRARPDVKAVVHTHPPYTTALSAVATPLEFVSHDAVLFRDGLAIFDETADLIVDTAQGKAVARALGSCRALLLRNHGVLAVGSSVPWVVYTALTLERACKLQHIARTLGPLQPISPEMVALMYGSKYNDGFTESYWAYLIREAQRRGYGDGMPPV